MRTAPIFFLLLPAFFVLNGVRDNFGFVPAGAAFLLLLVYLFTAIILFYLSYWFFSGRFTLQVNRNPENIRKAAFGSFSLMALHFFFGWIHDSLKNYFEGSFITKYTVLLPMLLLIMVLIFVSLKKRKDTLTRGTSYLNILFAILIGFELIMLTLAATGIINPHPNRFGKNAGMLKICDTCDKPDIYLVVLDEYAGHASLKKHMSFDNSPFELQMKQLGFHVVTGSRSNYNYTPFSMASLLNMEYPKLQDRNRKRADMRLVLSKIKENRVRRMLEANGYDFYNYSVFDMDEQPALIEESFIPAKTRLFTSQTLLSRLERDLWFHMVTTLQLKWAITEFSYRNFRNNKKLYDLTKNLVRQPSTKPRFVYTHLMMPHYPYYLDRNGKPLDPGRVLLENNSTNRKDYVEYLQYTNSRIVELSTYILKNSKKPPVIMFMSDHGFRHYAEPVDSINHFLNLNTVYIPSKQYGNFYDSLTNVNQFPQMFNTLFRANYPRLQDSLIVLNE